MHVAGLIFALSCVCEFGWERPRVWANNPLRAATAIGGHLVQAAFGSNGDRLRRSGWVAIKQIVLAVSLTVLLPATAAAHGPTPGLANCHMSTTRGAISPHFGIQACFDGSSVVLRNDLSLPVRVVPSGSVGGRSWLWRNPSPAAEATRVKSHDAQLLMPGEVIRVPIGSGSAQIQLQGASEADKTYALASAIASAIPGKVAGRTNTLARLISDAGDAYAKYQTCAERHRSVAGRAGCFAVLTRDVYFAIGRAGLAAVSKLLGPVIWGVELSKSVERQIQDLAFVLLHADGVFHIAAKAQAPPPPDFSGTYAGTWQSTFTAAHGEGCVLNMTGPVTVQVTRASPTTYTIVATLQNTLFAYGFSPCAPAETGTSVLPGTGTYANGVVTATAPPGVTGSLTLSGNSLSASGSVTWADGSVNQYTFTAER